MDGLDIEEALAELAGDRAPMVKNPGARAQAIDKVRYTHVDMVDFIIANPGISQGAIALRYGYTESWVSLIMSSDAFQELMTKRRAEVVDPTLILGLEERFRGLTVQSLTRLQKMLDQPAIPPSVVIRCAELGAKSLGLGGHAAPKVVEPTADSLDRLAQRLISLNRDNSIPGQVLEKEINSAEP